MTDETMRLRAEVVDAFSGPLRNLRAMLQGVSSAAPTDKLKSGMETAQRAATGLAREVNTTLTPALNAAGIAGLTVSGVLAGVGLAFRSFAGNASGLQLLSRETNMAVQSMRVLEEVGKRFNLAPEAMQQSFRSFAENSRLFRKGLGDTFTWLNSQGGVTGRWAQQLRADLNAGLNPDEAYKRALQFMRRIRDPIERGMFADKVFGNRQLGILGSEDIGKLIDDVEKKLGQLPKGAAEAALEFKRSWDDFITSMIRLRDTAGVTIMPMLKEITDATTKWLNEPGVKEGLGKAFESLGNTLRETDWAAIGKVVSGAMGAIGTAFTDAAAGIGHLQDAIKAFQDGRYLDVIRALDGKKIDPASGVPKLERQRDVVQQTLDHLSKLPQDRSGATGYTPQEIEAKREKLTEELKNLTEEIRKLREKSSDATIQQQSLTGGGMFGGATIQRAALTGMAGAGAMSSAVPPGFRRGGSVPSVGGGSRSWRNNNPGNLEFGPFARSMGATGSDGRFAVFPDYETGRRAQEKLLFESKGYRDLNLGQAINRWAPSSENNVGAYMRALPGFDPSKPMSAYSPEERSRLLDAMQKHEGWRAGASGLPIKPGQGFSGGPVHEGVLDIAKSIMGLGGVNRFTALNDRFHQNRRSQHREGLAGDFTLLDPKQSAAMAERVREMLRGAGLRDGKDFRVLDEYVNPSRGATGGHLHFELRSREAAEAYRKHMQRERRERENADRKMEGAATLDVNFRNPPPGMSTNSSISGMFKEVRTKRVVRPPSAGVDV